jgi:hypothetical protein
MLRLRRDGQRRRGGSPNPDADPTTTAADVATHDAVDAVASTRSETGGCFPSRTAQPRDGTQPPHQQHHHEHARRAHDNSREVEKPPQELRLPAPLTTLWFSFSFFRSRGGQRAPLPRVNVAASAAVTRRILLEEASGHVRQRRRSPAPFSLSRPIPVFEAPFPTRNAQNR